MLMTSLITPLMTSLSGVRSSGSVKALLGHQLRVAESCDRRQNKSVCLSVLCAVSLSDVLNWCSSVARPSAGL